MPTPSEAMAVAALWLRMMTIDPVAIGPLAVCIPHFAQLQGVKESPPIVLWA